MSAFWKTAAILARQAGVPGIGRRADEEDDGRMLFSTSYAWLVYVVEEMHISLCVSD